MLEGREGAKVTAKANVRRSHFCRMKGVISPPSPVDLFEGSLEVASVYHIIDSCINTGFLRSWGSSLLRWGCRKLFLFFHYVLLGHRRCCLIFAFSILFCPKLLGCLGFGLRRRRSQSGCGGRFLGGGNDRWRSRRFFDNGRWWWWRGLNGLGGLVRRSVRNWRFSCHRIVSGNH